MTTLLTPYAQLSQEPSFDAVLSKTQWHRGEMTHQFVRSASTPVEPMAFMSHIVRASYQSAPYQSSRPPQLSHLAGDILDGKVLERRKEKLLEEISDLEGKAAVLMKSSYTQQGENGIRPTSSSRCSSSGQLQRDSESFSPTEQNYPVDTYEGACQQYVRYRRKLNEEQAKLRSQYTVVNEQSNLLAEQHKLVMELVKRESETQTHTNLTTDESLTVNIGGSCASQPAIESNCHTRSASSTTESMADQDLHDGSTLHADAEDGHPDANEPEAVEIAFSHSPDTSLFCKEEGQDDQEAAQRATDFNPRLHDSVDSVDGEEDDFFPSRKGKDVQDSCSIVLRQQQRPSIEERSDSPRDIQQSSQWPTDFGKTSKLLSAHSGSSASEELALSTWRSRFDNESAQEVIRVRSLQMKEERTKLWAAQADPLQLMRQKRELDEREAAQARTAMELQAKTTKLKEYEGIAEVALSRSMALDRREAALRSREGRLKEAEAAITAKERELEALRAKLRSLEHN